MSSNNWPPEFGETEPAELSLNSKPVHSEPLCLTGHFWGDIWESQGYSIRQCRLCVYAEAEGPGGWTEIF